MRSAALAAMYLSSAIKWALQPGAVRDDGHGHLDAAGRAYVLAVHPLADLRESSTFGRSKPRYSLGLLSSAA